VKKISALLVVFSLALIIPRAIDADFLGIGKAAKKGYQAVATGVTKGYEETKKTAEQIGKEVSKVGGVVSDVGVKIGNVTVKAIAKAGEVTLGIAEGTGVLVLKTGQSFVTSSGMILLNTGGMIWALTKGDYDAFGECAHAISTSARYHISTMVDEELKAIGGIDRLVKITSLSIEGSSTDLALQGKTPKISVSGSFLGRDFNFKNIQVDLTRPDLLVATIFEELLKIKRD
jgi:hypothetical protein